MVALTETTTLEIADADLAAAVNPLIAEQIAAIPTVDLSDYPTVEEVKALIPAPVVVPPSPDLSSYATHLEVSSEISSALNGLPVPSSGGVQHELWLDDMPGATDDAKLDAAIARMLNGSVTRPIRLSARVHSFSTPRALKDGFKLIATGTGSQPRGANSIPCQVNWNGKGAMWSLDHNTFDVEFAGIGFQATAGGTFLAGHPSFVLWTSYFHDLGFVGFNGVYGSSAQKLLNTACAWSGWHNINNPTGTSINIGGSDSAMSFSRCLIDAPNAGQMPAGQFHIIIDHQQKLPVYNIYLTCNNVEGVRVVNNPADGGIEFIGCVFEGRNASTPSADQIIRVESGRVKFIGCHFNYAKVGVPHITMTGGDVQLVGCDFLAATGWSGPTISKGAGTAGMTGTTAAFGTPSIV